MLQNIMVMKAFGPAIVGMLFSSCMSVGMPTMHGSGEQHAEMDSQLEKEVTLHDVRAVAVFPVIELEKEAVFTLKLFNAGTKLPISSATIYFRAEHERVPHSTEMVEQENHDTAHLEQEVKESEKAGVYSISSGPFREGTKRIVFRVTAVGGRALEPEIRIEAMRRVAGEIHSGGHGMMGSGGGSVYAIIAGAAMAVLMVTMLVARGGMH